MSARIQNGRISFKFSTTLHLKKNGIVLILEYKKHTTNLFKALLLLFFQEKKVNNYYEKRSFITNYGHVERVPCPR